MNKLKNALSEFPKTEVPCLDDAGPAWSELVRRKAAGVVCLVVVILYGGSFWVGFS